MKIDKITVRIFYIIILGFTFSCGFENNNELVQDENMNIILKTLSKCDTIKDGVSISISTPNLDNSLIKYFIFFHDNVGSYPPYDFNCATINGHFIAQFKEPLEKIDENNPCVQYALEHNIISKKQPSMRSNENYLIFIFCKDNPNKYVISSHEETNEMYGSDSLNSLFRKQWYKYNTIENYYFRDLCN